MVYYFILLLLLFYIIIIVIIIIIIILLLLQSNLLYFLGFCFFLVERKSKNVMAVNVLPQILITNVRVCYTYEKRISKFTMPVAICNCELCIL